MKKVLVLMVFIFSLIHSQGQDCDFYFPSKKGASLTYENFNAKGKSEGKNKQTVKDIKAVDGGTEMTITVESFDDKGQVVLTSDYTLLCKDGLVIIDMSKFLSPEQLSGFEDMDVSITTENMELPKSLSPGMSLKDATITIKVSTGGMTMMNMTTRIKNRKVEAIEKVTTPAGTFEAYKITYEIEVKTFTTISAKASEWFVPNTGVVKTESYDRKGAMSGYSLLTEIKK